MFNRYRWMRKTKRKISRFMTAPTNVVILVSLVAVVVALWATA